MSEWRTIETAPKNCAVLLFDGKKVRIGRWTEASEHRVRVASKYGLHHGNVWVYEGRTVGESAKRQPTHWMPLPDPPK